MPRETLDNKIKHLKDEILILDSMVEQSILESVQALKKRDIVAAQRIYDADKQVNTRRFEIENECMVTLATQQPIMAHDLRLLASILEVTSELERMGDYAKGIAHICLVIGNQTPVKPLIDIPRMADLAVSMLNRAVDAFINSNVYLARSIPPEDDQIDQLYNQVYRELVTIMFTDPSTIDQANYLMWAAHNLERLADRVTNICERTIYAATGLMEEFLTSNDEWIYPK